MPKKGILGKCAKIKIVPTGLWEFGFSSRMAQFFAKWLLLLTPASWGNKVFEHVKKRNFVSPHDQHACRPLKLGIFLQVRDIKEVDTEKRRIKMEASLTMSWDDPRAKCSNQACLEERFVTQSLIWPKPRNLHVWYGSVQISKFGFHSLSSSDQPWKWGKF